MATVKIRMNTWANGLDRSIKFKRGLAPRNGFIDYNPETKNYFFKAGDMKWKPYDTSISRKQDSSYIAEKKKFNEGLCFESQKAAKQWLVDHKDIADKMASENPLFVNWSVMNVSKKFAPEKNRIVYEKDVIKV